MFSGPENPRSAEQGPEDLRTQTHGHNCLTLYMYIWA